MIVFYYCWQYLLNEGRKEMPPIVIRFTFIGFSSVFARNLVRVYVFQWKIFASGRKRPIQIIRCKKLFVRFKCWFTDSFRFIKPQMDSKSITLGVSSTCFFLLFSLTQKHFVLPVRWCPKPNINKLWEWTNIERTS